MEYVKRNIRVHPWYGETHTFQAMIVGFHQGYRSVYVKQDEEHGDFRLPLKMFDEESIHTLKRIDIGKVATLRMATGIAKKAGVKILTSGEKKESVVMSEKFQVTEEDSAPVDPNRMTVAEIHDKLSIMGEIHDMLRDEGYVAFSMSGNKMQARIYKSHCLGDYVQK